MPYSAGSEHSRLLREHRTRMSKLLWVEGDHGFGKAAWYEGVAFLEEVVPEVDDIFPAPDRPSIPMRLPLITITPPTPSTITPSPPPTVTPPPIPDNVQRWANYINQLPKNKDGLPSRNRLRKDNHLRGEVSRKTGYLRVEKRKGQLRRFRGDDRLFSKQMWDHLAGNDDNENENEAA